MKSLPVSSIRFRQSKKQFHPPTFSRNRPDGLPGDLFYFRTARWLADEAGDDGMGTTARRGWADDAQETRGSTALPIPFVPFGKSLVARRRPSWRV